MTDYALTLFDIAVRGLRGVSLALLPGEIAGVVGPAGAGKTTLLQVAAGCMRPTRGEAWVWGCRVTDANARKLIGYAGDQAAFPRSLRVREVLLYYARLHAAADLERTPHGLVREALELAGLGAARNLLVGTLGHADLQRLALAQALLGGRRVLVLDEFFTNLDAIARRDLRGRIARLAAEGVAVLIAARDPAALDEHTVQELLAWLGANRALWNGVPTSFTVNLSIATLEDERFLTKVGAALNTHGIAAETLGFEIAESLCGQQRAKVERFFAQCEKLGVWIAIDDFSFDSQMLPLLRSKALRMLKLDARLTAAALRDKLSQAMVVASVQAAKVLGIHCSAKKADSHASLQYLAAIGLDYAQGTAPTRTVPLEAIATIVDSRSGGNPIPENNE